MIEQYDKRATGQNVTGHILAKKKKRLSPLRVHRIEDIFNTQGHWRQTFSYPICLLRLPRFSLSDTFRLVKLLPCTPKPVYSHVILSN